MNIEDFPFDSFEKPTTELELIKFIADIFILSDYKSNHGEVAKKVCNVFHDLGMIELLNFCIVTDARSERLNFFSYPVGSRKYVEIPVGSRKYVEITCRIVEMFDIFLRIDMTFDFESERLTTTQVAREIV